MRACENRITQIHRLVEGELTSEQESELNEHLQECPSCAEQMREFLRLKSVIEETLDAEIKRQNGAKP